MQVVILCGGKGTRLRGHSERIPKPLVEVGDRPIIWHIMKLFSHYGHKDFILCLGYKGDMIKKYFLEYQKWNNDFSLKLHTSNLEFHSGKEDWNITFADTGQETQSGGRVKQIEKYIKEDKFFLCYADGLTNANPNDLLEFHNQNQKLASILCIQPRSQFGLLEINNNLITNFKEKPLLNQWINGGIFVFNKEAIAQFDDQMFEDSTLLKLAQANQLAGYQFKGFWACMDTYKDNQTLNELWKSNPPWKIWRD